MRNFGSKGSNEETDNQREIKTVEKRLLLLLLLCFAVNVIEPSIFVVWRNEWRVKS